MNFIHRNNSGPKLGTMVYCAASYRPLSKLSTAVAALWSKLPFIHQLAVKRAGQQATSKKNVIRACALGHIFY